MRYESIGGGKDPGLRLGLPTGRVNNSTISLSRLSRAGMRMMRLTRSSPAASWVFGLTCAFNVPIPNVHQTRTRPAEG
jgi:hypothetical protein